jgi:hypothetical protein
MIGWPAQPQQEPGTKDEKCELRRSHRGKGWVTNDLSYATYEGGASFVPARRRFDPASKPGPTGVHPWFEDPKLLYHAPLERQLRTAAGAGGEMLLDEKPVRRIELTRCVPGEQRFGLVVGPVG